MRALVEHYAPMAAKRDTTKAGLHALVQIADVDRAIRQLKLDFRRIVLLHGRLGLDARTVGELLQVSHTAVAKRYRQALEEIHYLMNGGE